MWFHTAQHEDMVHVVSQGDRPQALFATLGAAGLSRTDCSRRRLHGIVVAFMLSVFSYCTKALGNKF